MYFQHKNILNQNIINYNWIVVEQDNYVSYGQSHLQDTHLRFVSCEDPQLINQLSEIDIDIIIIRGSLQYISDFKSVVDIINKLNANYIVLDRVPIAESEMNCIQKVPPCIYDAEYPVHIFTHSGVLSLFENNYSLVEFFKSRCDDDDYIHSGIVQHRCYVFKNKY